LQVLSHVPQCFGSVDRGAHSAPQMEYPASQEGTHCPISQRRSAAQTNPHFPQLRESLEKSLTQRPSHAVAPAWQCKVQTASSQAPSEPVHRWLQVPHAAADEYKSTHRDPHVVSGGAHAATHPEAAQSGAVSSQWVLQEPQLLGLERSASQPLVGLPSQSAQPTSQVPMTQAPAWHTPNAWLGLQGAHPSAPHPVLGSLGPTQ